VCIHGKRNTPWILGSDGKQKQKRVVRGTREGKKRESEMKNSARDGEATQELENSINCHERDIIFERLADN